MVGVNGMIEYGKSLIGKVHYSMNTNLRRSAFYRDCSSFVISCLIAGGFIPASQRYGNTETLYAYKGQYLQEIYSYSQVQRGDIFITGYQGRSGGAAGHTGIFLSSQTIMDCSYREDGVKIRPAWCVLSCKRSNHERYFRPISSKKSPTFIKEEHWTATLKYDINVRTSPYTSGKYYTTLKAGSRVKYDSVYKCDGYRRLSRIDYKGVRLYMAYRPENGTPRVTF